MEISSPHLAKTIFQAVRKLWQEIKRTINEWFELRFVAGHSEQYRKALGMELSELKKLRTNRELPKSLTVVEVGKEEFVILAVEDPCSDTSIIIAKCITNSDPELNMKDRNGMNFIHPWWHTRIANALNASLESAKKTQRPQYKKTEA